MGSMRRDLAVSGSGSQAAGRAAAALVLAGLLGLGAIGGCTETKPEAKTEPPKPRYAELPPKQKVPSFMKGTVWEVTDVENKLPYLVSGYGMVVGLDGTGSNRNVPMPLRNYMIDEMVRHRFGSRDTDYAALKPEAAISDPRTSIVEVMAYLLPGSRKGDRLDVFVQPAGGSQTSSLAHGMLYLTDLSHKGELRPLEPKGGVDTYVRAMGPVFVNPGYIVGQAGPNPGAARASLRNGIVMNGGMVMQDRPLWFHARIPELRITRAIEMRINQRFEDKTVAKTQDEGIVNVFVPKRFRGDWEHFVGVATHLYLNGTPGVGALKAKELVAEAVKPDAPLQDISFCWEGIGEEAVPAVQQLYAHPSPDVAFAAARAGAFIGDMAAEQVLLEIARTEAHPFQFNAVKVMGSLGDTPRLTRMLRELLSSKNALVRIEAYRILADQADFGQSPAGIVSRTLGDTRRGQFVLDQVPCEGTPMVYATRSGVPRIAIFGPGLKLRMPIMFSAMNGRFTISTSPDGGRVVVFDRTRDTVATGVSAAMRPDVFELIYRLGGGGDEPARFSFGYSDLVGIVQQLAATQQVKASFVLQDSPGMQDAIDDAPPIVEPVGQAAPK